FSRSALALVYAENGRHEEAIEQFDQIASTGFTGGQRDYQWLVAMSWLAEGCAFASDSERAPQLYEVFRGYADPLAVVGALLCLGSVSRYLGLLAVAASSFADAQRHFEVGLQTNRRMGSTLWMAHCQYECAALQVDHGDREHAHKLLDDCLRSARALGYVRLIEAAEVLAARSSRSPEQSTSSNLQHETQTHQRETTPALEPSSDRSGGDAAIQNVFRREGDIWTITYEGQTLRLRDLKGLSYISRLLQNPGEEFHVLSLVTEIDAAT